MQVDVDYDAPEKQPDVAGCQMVIQSVDLAAITVTGVCIQASGPPIPFRDLPVGAAGMAALVALSDATGAALQVEIDPATGNPYLPPSKVVIKP